MRISDWSSDVCSSDLLRRITRPSPSSCCSVCASMRSLTPFTLRRNALKRSVPVSVAYAGGTLPAHCQRSGGRDLLHTDVHGLAADYGHELRAFGDEPLGSVCEYGAQALEKCCFIAQQETGRHFLRIEQRSEGHQSELQSLMRISYAVFCLKKKKRYTHNIKL